LLADTFQPLRQSLRFDIRKGLPIYSRRTLIGSHQFIGMDQNVLAVHLVVKQVEAVLRFVLRLAIQLDLKFPDTTWCCQTHRQSPSFPASQAHQQARALCSASITWPQRSYDPL